MGHLPISTFSISAFQYFFVTLSRLWCYAGIRQILPGSQSRRCPEAHRRGQPLHSQARNAKNAPESAICGVLRRRSTTTGSVFLLVPISLPKNAPRGVGRTNLRSVALPRRSHAKAGPISAFSMSAFQNFSFYPPRTFPFPLFPLRRTIARLFVMGGTNAQLPIGRQGSPLGCRPTVASSQSPPFLLSAFCSLLPP